MRHGALKYVTTNKGHTPLHVAAMNHSLNVFLAFVEGGDGDGDDCDGGDGDVLCRVRDCCGCVAAHYLDFEKGEREVSFFFFFSLFIYYLLFFFYYYCDLLL